MHLTQIECFEKIEVGIGGVVDGVQPLGIRARAEARMIGDDHSPTIGKGRKHPEGAVGPAGPVQEQQRRRPLGPGNSVVQG